MPYDQLFKCVIVGDRGVGKSCLLLRFTDQGFRAQHDLAAGVGYGVRIITVDGKRTKLQIWDTAGQEPFRAVTMMSYTGATAAILVYDITRRETFDHVTSWLKDAMHIAPSNLTVMLVGNKCDMSDRRAVSYEESERFAKEHGLLFMEASAKTGQNVVEAFTMTARIVSKEIENGVIDLSDKKKAQSKEALCWGARLLEEVANTVFEACKGWRLILRRN